MVLDYGTTADIPTDQYNVVAGGTVAVSAAFDATVGVIGGMDTAAGSLPSGKSTGDVITVDSVSDAQSYFGDDSELYEQIRLHYNNGAAEVKALPLPETTTTETFSATASGTLANTPAFDPNVQPEHDITAQDDTGTTITVNIVYDEGTNIATPSASETINLNPITGEFEADTSDTYDITYTYGDFSTSNIADIAAEEPRILHVCTENETVVTDADTEAQSRADNFVFMHVVAGAKPFASTSSPDTTGYSDGLDTERVSLVAASRGYVDEAETEEVRSTGAVAGYLAGLQLGLSSTNDEIGGLTGLRTDLQPSGAADLIDAQVMPLIDYPPVTIVKDMTTSTTQKFERVYTMQILDEVTELSHTISRTFVGEQQTPSERQQLRRSHANMLIGLVEETPPLIATRDDYTVNVSKDSSDDNVTNVELGVKPVGVMDTIDVTIAVGDVVRQG